MSPAKPNARLRGLAVALGILAAIAAGPRWSGPAQAGPLDLPDIGSSSDALMTTAGEVRLGKAFMRSVRSALPVSDDPMTTDYLESLGNELLAADRDAKGRFSFFLIDEPVVNAFAGPGGYIGVYAGLILATQSEDELAAVMAHEIAHVTQRHLMRSVEDQSKMSIPTAAVMVAAAILGAQVSGDAAVAALAGVQAAALQRQINFTRENEKEADRIGIATLAAAGRSPYAMAGFFDRLSKSSRVAETDVPELLRTHPVNTNRIADALGRADEYGARQRLDSLRFNLARARLRERSYDRPEKSVEAFRASLREGRYRDQTAERYGLALALFRAGQLEAARAESLKLLNEHPAQPDVVVLDAQIALKQGRGAEAVSELRQAVGLFPGSWALRTVYANALLEAGNPREAMEQLKAVVRMHPAEPGVYEMLEQAAIKSGNKAAALRYRGEKLYAEGELEPAIRQLEFALRQRDLPYHDAAQIQALLESMKEEEKEQKERGRGPEG